MKIAALFSELFHYHVARYRALLDGARRHGHATLLLAMRHGFPGLPAFPYHAALGHDVQIILPPGQFDVDGRDAQGQLLALLDANQPDVVLIPGYARPYARAVLRWCRRRGAGAVLMSESRHEDFSRSPARERFKRWLVGQFDAALVGGQPHVAYAHDLGLAPDAVFTGYDVVDNAYWTAQTDAVRADADRYRAQLALPERYFFAVNRFIEKKNLPGLLRAYARYAAAAGDGAWHLVLAGTGPLAASLADTVADLGLAAHVHFPGYVSAERLAPYYALAGAFVHPSSHAEQWGLVVNEAMASRLPVLVSRTVGCVADLVIDGQTGFTFDPHDERALAETLERVAALSAAARAQLGRQAWTHIQQYGPEQFAAGALAASAVAQARARRRPGWQRAVAVLPY